MTSLQSRSDAPWRETSSLGEFGSLTGDGASVGISQNNGVQMAVQEINNTRISGTGH